MLTTAQGTSVTSNHTILIPPQGSFCHSVSPRTKACLALTGLRGPPPQTFREAPDSGYHTAGLPGTIQQETDACPENQAAKAWDHSLWVLLLQTQRPWNLLPPKRPGPQADTLNLLG